jgi:progressive ankylosis protein
MTGAADRSSRAILIFWIPLALQWVMMALEGPFLAAVIARLDEPTFNLAAYGVAFAFAILVESPVIMLMSASTALVEDARSYRKLRAFANQLNLLSTGLLVLLLVPPVFDLILRRGLGLPDGVADLVYGSLWILLPWPAAIGYRRFLHGVLIREGRTRLVAYGTAIRLGAMAATGLALAGLGIPGAWVGAGALSTGVVVEALAARLMARGTLAEVLSRFGGPDESGALSDAVSDAELEQGVAEAIRETGASAGAVRAVGAMGRAHAPPSDDPEERDELEFREILRFYYPLALTSLIGLSSQPLLTFFMGRAPSPVESLAVFPVVMALYFLFGTMGLSYQEAAIALVGRKGEHRREVGRFARGLSLVATGGLALIAFTPLARLWFVGVSGLTSELAALAYAPAQLIALAPGLSVILGFQRAQLVQARRTRPITVSTMIEVATIGATFPVLAWGLGWMGVTAAMGALVLGRLLGVIFLAIRLRRLGMTWLA